MNIPKIFSCKPNQPLKIVLWYTGVISGGHVVKVLKVPKLPQTKVFEKKSKNFWRPGVGPVEKSRFLAFSWVSCHFGSYLVNYQI